MCVTSLWTPRLIEGTGSSFGRLVAALAEDALESRLATGNRLPAHRGRIS